MSPSHAPFPAQMAVLFEEDFDQPPAPETPPEPEIVEPSFSGADMEAVRAEGWQEGHTAGLAAAEATSESVARQALSRIAEQAELARSEVTALVETNAEAIAQLLMDAFAAAFPSMCAKHGAPELRRAVQKIIPPLRKEPRITVRVCPQMAADVTDEISRLDPEMQPRIQVIATETMRPGDIRVNWEDGEGTRDTARLWNEIYDILAAEGLISPRATIKEPEHVE
ncbi:MAG: hypothetical protein AB7F35_06205 [Acetobacteraceae bacterium]